MKPETLLLDTNIIVHLVRRDRAKVGLRRGHLPAAVPSRRAARRVRLPGALHGGEMRQRVHSGSTVTAAARQHPDRQTDVARRRDPRRLRQLPAGRLPDDVRRLPQTLRPISTSCAHQPRRRVGFVRRLVRRHATDRNGAQPAGYAADWTHVESWMCGWAAMAAGFKRQATEADASQDRAGCGTGRRRPSLPIAWSVRI